MSIFKNKLSIVTGGASGIGRAMALQLANQGSSVVLADVQHEAASKVAEEICRSGGVASAHSLDVTDNTAVENFVEKIAMQEGRVDYMFNNAGIAILGDFQHLPAADWKQTLDVNVGGVFSGTAAAYALMIRQGHGHIVNIASVAGLVPALGIVAYCASKHAVVGLSTSLRAEAAVHGVKVSVVCPGFVRTPMLDSKTVGAPTDEAAKARIVKLAISPEMCAKKALAGVVKNKAVIPITGHARLLWMMQRCCPGLLRAYSRRIAKRMHLENENDR